MCTYISWISIHTEKVQINMQLLAITKGTVYVGNMYSVSECSYMYMHQYTKQLLILYVAIFREKVS